MNLSTLFLSKTNTGRNKHIGKLLSFVLFTMMLFGSAMSWGQTVVTVGGGASVTCPAVPTATWTTPPTGVSFSNWSRGASVSCASAANALSGSGFNTASAAVSFTGNKYYSVTITADATHNFSLNSVVWNTAISSGTGVFDVQYSNNGGALTAFGTAAQTSSTSNTFTGTVNVSAGTALVLYLIPSNTGAAGTSVRWLNGSTITVTATSATPTFISTQDGPWSSGSTWVGGVVPSAGSTVNVVHNVTITTGGGAVSNTGIININTGGTLLCQPAPALTGGGVVNINAGTLDIEQNGWPGITNSFVYAATGTLKFNNSSGSYGVNSSDIWWPTSSGPQNVNVAGAGGITMNTARTVGTLFQTSAGVSLNAVALTLNGNCQINGGGFFNNAPTYGSSSLLKYNINGTYARGSEWSATSGAGFPNDVQLSNNTVLNVPNTGAGAFSTAMAVGRDLTIDASSALYMDFGNGGNKSGSLTVARNLSMAGDISLGDAVGGDMFVGGNWTRTSGTFTTNSRQVSFNGSVSQSITGNTTFAFIKFNNSAGFTLGASTALIVNNQVDLTLGKVTIGANDLTIGSGAGFINAGSGSYIITNSTGSVKRLAVSNTSKSYPIGPSSSFYTPLSITNNGTTNDISGSVSSSITNAVTDPTKIVTLQWTVTSGGAGASADIGFNWNAGNQAGSFNAGGTGELGNYTSGPHYAITSLGTLSGTSISTTVLSLAPGVNLLVLGNAGAVYTPVVVGPPTVTTPTATAIANTTATLGGNVTSDGNDAVTERGIVWSSTTLNGNPVIGGANVTKVSTTGTTGVFTVATSGLPAATGISYKAYATNAQGTGYTSVAAFTTLANPTTTTATAIIFTNTTASSVQLNWTNGDGANRIVVARLTATTRVAPANGNGYTANSASFTDGLNSTTGTGNVVVYNGTGSTLTVTGLSAGTAYTYDIYEYNGSGATANYGAVASGAKTTLPAEPTTQATSVSFTNISATGFKINWVLGNGANSIVLVKDGSAVDSDPVDGTSYTVSGTFGSGSQIGTGNYVVYRATVNNVTVSGLTAGHTYFVAVYTYNGTAGSGTENYLTTTAATGSQIAETQTYYSQGSLDPSLLSSWNTVRLGGGSAPTSLTTDVSNYVIQNGHTMITTTAFSFGPSGSKLEIENGGVLAAGHPITIPAGMTFQIDNGGKYQQNAAISMGSTIFGGTEVFAANSTIEYTINPSGTSAPSAPGYGNLIINVTTGATALGWSNTITAVQGNLTVLGTGAGTTRHAFAAGTAQTLTIGGNFTISGGNMWLSSGAGGVTVNLTGDLLINGGLLDLANSSGVGVINVGGNITVSSGTLTEGGSTTTSKIVFNKTGTQSFTSGGTISNTVGFEVNTGSTTNLGTNVISGGGAVTVDNGATLQVGSTSGSGAINGNITATGGLTLPAGSTVEFNGAAAQFAATRIYSNLTINNTNGVTLSGNVTVGSVLNLNAGNIITAANSVVVTNSATNAITRTSGHVIGNLQRAVATGTNNYAYPVGTASGYTPANITFNGTTGAGNVTVVSLNGASSNYPPVLSATKRLARYWTVTNSGVTGFSADATFTYLNADLTGGATQSSVKPYKFDAPSTFSYPSSSTGTLSFTESGITNFSEFGAGECGTVTVNPITGGGASLCIGATQQLASTTAGGVWTSDAAGIASVSSGGLVTANLNGATTIHYTVTDISGCTGEATQSVTVLPNYTITASAGANGSISPNGITTICSGNNQAYTITPNACYSIANVVVDGVSQGAVGTYTFTNVTANHTISATFVLNTYTITVTSGANGSITPATGSVNCGANATYTITPNACYSIADIVVDGVSQGAVGTYTFTNVTANHTISATFVLNTYTITVTAGANGSITPATGSVNCGSNATYTITPNACYSIADVVIDGVSQGAVGTYTFTNVTAAHTISATFVLNTYTITVTAGANGSITPATGSVNCGANATYTITPNACYAIADVVVDGVSQGAVGTYTFTNVSAAHTISATFALTNYTITITAGANGSITPATGTVNCGDNATYTITANACYSIADVVVDGVSQGAIGTYTFTNVTANHTISATFVLNTYTITVTAGANGSITPATGSVNCGDNATYTITANACYSIADVVVDGVSQGAIGTYTFTNVTAAHTISATFVLNTYTITVTAGANGSITPATGSVNCGANATYTITPNACYAIADVVVDGVSQGAVGTYTFTNVTAAHTISATFVLNSYTITVTAGANGSITPATGSVNCGSNATYTITPNACYSIADVVVDGVSQGAVGTYTFTNVTAAHSISATFVLNTYTITVTSGANGSITPATGSVNCGANATYTITPNACYSIADVVVDGVSQGAVGTYTFTNVTAAHTISATFVLNTYTITVTAGANGSITPATGSVNCGDNAAYTITPNACYSIADVVVDGVSQGAVGTYTFTNVTAAHTISATFALTTYTITVTAGANGSITPATGSINCGDNATYTITANACYSIADVVVDGVSQGAVGTYTFTNVTANHTISATFVLNTYTITVTAGANGSITPATGSVNCGDNATYTITPNACYSIADVVVDGVSQGAVGTYTFTNVTAAHTISATFVLNTYTITVTAGANGSITPATGSVNCGSNATYTISPNACYSIADVVVDGVSQGAVGTYTFTNLSAAHTISATFVLTNYTITVTAGAHGSITPATGTVNCGDNATYTITANACYSIGDVVVDGVSQGAVGTYTFTNVTANHSISATFVLNTYTITVTAGANGSIAPATGSVNCGSNATYTITPNACYSIADVVVDGVSQGAVGTYTFTNVTANHTISATFVLNTYTITVTAGANGSITPATGSVNCGANATYTITPNACYSIADVVVDGVSQGAIGTYTFTNLTAAHTISATFALTTYTIAVTAGANGSITPATGSVNCGDNATYTITPNACYSIADVIVDGVSQGAVGTYTFTNVTANHTISATFVINTYSITVTAGANGSITPATGSVNCGSNATYTITPNACYSIADVVVDGVSQGVVGTYTFTNVTAAHTISATFVLNTYTITVTAGANGSITPATGSVNCGANATYTITANGGYAVQDVIVDGVSQGPIGTYTFTNVTANHAISATFVVSGGGTFTITSSAGANGSISPNGATVVNSGANQTYTITPVACYHVADVLVDGISVGAVTTYTFTNVTANHTISAGFAANTLTVSVSGPINVCPYIGTGTQVTYTATAAGATGFTWVIPPTNVTIISGQGTANLTVTFQNGFAGQANKQLRVTALSPCGNSPIFVYYLAVQIPSTPQPIVGTTSVCSVIGTAGTLSYTIPSVPGASSYNWLSQQPANTTITHPNGLGVNDTTVNISFGAGFTSSSITVSASNQGCGTSGVRSLALTKTNPSQPGLISGPTNACAYMAPGGTVATYSIVAVAGATSYTWTVPAGAIGVTPQGTTSISFTYPNSFVSGTVSVTATNGCGTSVARSLSITKLAPSTPSVIDVIQVASCPDRIYTYTLSAMPSNATSVQWTAPAGGTITNGQGTAGITVSYTAAAVNGNVTAQAINNCGSSTIRISPVKLGSCQLEKAIVSKGSTVPATTASVESMQVNVFPNPSVSDFKLQVVTAGKQTINVRIMDAQGRNTKTFVVMPYQTINVGSDLKAGAYIMEVRQGNGVKVTKLLKF